MEQQTEQTAGRGIFREKLSGKGLSRVGKETEQAEDDVRQKAVSAPLEELAHPLAPPGPLLRRDRGRGALLRHPPGRQDPAGQQRRVGARDQHDDVPHVGRVDDLESVSERRRRGPWEEDEAAVADREPERDEDVHVLSKHVAGGQGHHGAV